MAVTIRLFDVEATARGGQWECEDRIVLALLRRHAGRDRISPADGDPDHAAAALAVRCCQADIVRADPIEPDVPGRVY